MLPHDLLPRSTVFDYYSRWRADGTWDNLLAALRRKVREAEGRNPEPTAAFVPQFFAGIRTEAAAVEHYDRLERRTRETVRLGSWVTPRVIDFALRQTEKVSEKANRVFDPSTSSGHRAVDVLLTPSIAHRPPRVGILDRAGSLRASLRATPAIRVEETAPRPPSRTPSLPLAGAMSCFCVATKSLASRLTPRARASEIKGCCHWAGTRPVLAQCSIVLCRLPSRDANAL